jgi:deazaflavin-dependent oxidoreductase (nitroreductase family)
MSKLVRAGAAVHGFLYRQGLARKMGQMQTVLLTTTGRKSGRPQTVALGAVREGDGWVVIGSNGGADADRERIWNNVRPAGKATRTTPRKRRA